MTQDEFRIAWRAERARARAECRFACPMRAATGNRIYREWPMRAKAAWWVDYAGRNRARAAIDPLDREFRCRARYGLALARVSRIRAAR